MQITLGEYPSIGISAARELPRATREQVRNGATPTADKRKARTIGKAERQAIDTLDSLLNRACAAPERPADLAIVAVLSASRQTVRSSRLQRVSIRRAIAAA